MISPGTKLPPFDARLLDDVTVMLNEMARQRVQAKHRAVMDSLRVVEGCIPPPDVLVQNGKWLCWPDGREVFEWRGRVLVEITPTP